MRGRGRGTRSSSSARSRSRSASTSAARRSCGRSCRTGCCPCSSSTATRGSSAKLLQELHAGRAGALRRGERGGAARARAGRRSSSRTTCSLGGPVGAASGLPFAVKAHGSELEYSMRGRPELERVGRGGARRRATRVFVGSRAHPRGAGGGRRPRRARPRGAAGRRRRGVPARGRAPRRSRRSSPRRGATRRTRGTRGAAPRRGQRRAARGVPRRRRADGRLLREAARQQGRPPPARGAARRSTRAP